MAIIQSLKKTHDYRLAGFDHSKDEFIVPPLPGVKDSPAIYRRVTEHPKRRKPDPRRYLP